MSVTTHTINLRAKVWLSFLLVGSMWFSASLPAAAHEIRPAIFELTLNDDKTFTLSGEVNAEAIVAGIGSEHEDTDESPEAERYNALRAMSSDDLKSAFNGVAGTWMKAIGLSFDDEPAAMKMQSLTVPPVGDVEVARLSNLALGGGVSGDAKTITWAYPKEYGASILRIKRPGQETFAQFYPAGMSSGPLDLTVSKPQSFWQTVKTYVHSGFIHIIPEGLDHILFVLGLFLLSQHWKPLLAQVTAFTLAHTITLALGLYGIVQIAPSIVEPLIALSIVYVAVENIFTKKLHVWRPIIVFLFGLLHGLGFAGVLQEVGLPESGFVTALISFNVGVELGQLAVIAIAFALVGWFMKKSWYRRLIVIPASVAIAAMGAYWFLERTVL